MFKYIAPLIFMAGAATANEMADATRHACTTFEQAGSVLFLLEQDILFHGVGVYNHLTGEQQHANVAFHVNQDTGGWTLVSLHEGNIACVIMSGYNFLPYVGEKNVDSH